MCMRLNEKERQLIERVLKGFGFWLRGGSSEIRKDGKIIYHLSIDTGCCCNVGYRLGPMLKKALNADEIYLMGLQIA